MSLNIQSKIAELIRLGATGTFVLLISACGGGQDTLPGQTSAINSANTAAATDGVLTLSLSDESGALTNSMTFNKPLKVRASVKNAKGQFVPDALVVFSTDPQLGVFSIASGSVKSDVNGFADIILSPSSLTSAGAGVLKVAALFGEKSLQSQTIYSVSASRMYLSVISPVSNPSILKAYGSSIITLDVQGEGGIKIVEPFAINLNSLCVTLGKATLPAHVNSVNGRVQIVYRDKGCAQADTVVASITGTNTTAKFDFQIIGPDAASIKVTSVMPSDRALVIKGAGGTNRTELGTFTFKVVDQFGNPLANQAVRFSTISTKTVTLNKMFDTTDNSGEVITTVNSGTEPTSLRVLAVLDNGVSTISDTLVVSNGLAVKEAFSLSVHNYNIEGFGYDNAQTDVNILLADQFGNPVTDGTPVSFQTDSGAIGSSDRGGCVTVNGGCTAVFRSQNPRFSSDTSAPQHRAGLATISVATSDNTNIPIVGTTAIFLSESFATKNYRIFDDGTIAPLDNTGVTLINIGCNPMAVRVQFNDSHLNPLPSQSALTSTPGENLEVSDILPAVVPTTAPRYINGLVVGAQGTTHTILLKPSSTKCTPGGSKTLSDQVSIKVTTPNGNVTVLPISMRFPI